MEKSPEQLNKEGRELWNQKAIFWDSLHGNLGNRFHQELVSPSVENLLALAEGETVLDIACGSGVMARRLAALGGIVTAVDFSEGLIEQARKRGQKAGHPVQYQVVDATDETALSALGIEKFDAVVSTMALMDIPVIEPLFRAAYRLLVKNGRFVFATAHPAFNSNNPIFVAEEADNQGQITILNALKITKYLEIPPQKAVGAVGEPAAHYYYHRPLSQLLKAAFEAGFVLDGLEEPAFEQTEESQPPLSWYALFQIPPILVGRLKK